MNSPGGVCPICGSNERSLKNHISVTHSKEDLLNALLDSTKGKHIPPAPIQPPPPPPPPEQQPMMVVFPLILPQATPTMFYTAAESSGPYPPVIPFETSEFLPLTNPEEVSEADNDEVDPLILEPADTNPTKTVESVSELKSVLKSDEEFQVVVSSELADSEEFKKFISNFDKTKKDDKIAKRHPPLSPQPCSSRDISQGGFDESFMSEEGVELEEDEEEEEEEEEDDDDITLKDLVALETMEEDGIDDDHYFTLNSNNPLEPYVNSIIQQQQQQISAASFDNFSCEKCGALLSSFTEYEVHLQGKCRRKGGGRIKNRKEPVVLKKEESNNTFVNEVDECESVTEYAHSSSASNQPVLGAAESQHWKCHVCKVVFKTGPKLLEHLETVRRAEYKCTVCHIIFENKKESLLHKKAHPSFPKTVNTEKFDPILNSEGEYVCDKCDRAFKDKDMILKHMTCHQEEKPFECLECGKKFLKESFLKVHRKRHFETANFKCVICQKKFFTPNKLREHVRIHTGETPLSCNLCNKSFKRHSNLSDHKKNAHGEAPPREKPLKELFCECGKVFSTRRDLDWHKEAEHERRPKKCTYCGEIFVHSSNLTRHIRLRHENNFIPSDKKTSLYAKCPICEQLFYKSSISKHVRIKHQGEKAFSCDICKRSFVTKHNLLNHQWQHKGVRSRPFKCHLCPKAYLRKGLLETHLRSHRGIKPYVCNECGFQFVNKSNWQRHVQEHSGSRNFECPRCFKKFSRGYYLTDHLKVHTGEKPFACGICGKRTATRSNYNSHLKTHIIRDPINSEV